MLPVATGMAVIVADEVLLRNQHSMQSEHYRRWFEKKHKVQSDATEILKGALRELEDPAVECRSLGLSYG